MATEAQHFEHRRSGGADRRELAAWEPSAFTALRPHRDLVTVVDDELPELDEWLAARSGSKN